MSEKCFTNKSCPYYPCHVETEGQKYNCMFCFCPLYTLGEECGGDFTYTSSGIKDCSPCTLPHEGEEGWQHVMRNIGKVAEKARQKQPEDIKPYRNPNDRMV